MKIISIKQPWAWLIVSGAKDVENRTWPTSYRGPILVHASGRPDQVTPRQIESDFDIRPPDDLALGGVVGITEIVDCVTNHPSKWFVGEYGFVLKNSKPLPFVPWKGQLGVRDAPAALLRKLKL